MAKAIVKVEIETSENFDDEIIAEDCFIDTMTAIINSGLSYGKEAGYDLSDVKTAKTKGVILK